MHWSDQIAQTIIARRPDKTEYVCAAGISPSGSIHIGNFRDVATSYFVMKALQRAGKQAKLLFSWDEFDRMRKVPKNVAATGVDFEQHVGKPYVDVPNPFPESGHANYAAYFEDEFIRSVESFGLPLDFRYQAQKYRNGDYTAHIRTALDKRREIFDIIDRHRSQEAQPGEREAYCPVSIYCPNCGTDNTKAKNINGYNAEYTCACGHSGTFDFERDHNCKLGWKIDWPMRWMVEGVDFEPGGKDHATPHSSYDVGSDIAREIFGIEPPFFQGYEFIGIKGATGKMSGSTGLNLTPDVLLNLYQPEIILWLYSKSDPLKAFDFCFDYGILRHYFEFDKMLTSVRDGNADDVQTATIDNCIIAGREIETVPMGLLVQLGSIVDFNVPMLEIIFEKINTSYKFDQFADRLNRARFWLDQCAPHEAYRLRKTRNFAVYETLSEDLKAEVAALHGLLCKGGYDLDLLNQELYAIPKTIFGEDDMKILKKAQGDFFKTVYQLLLDRDKGPRLYLFLYAIDPQKVAPLLDFSTPQTEEDALKQGDGTHADGFIPYDRPSSPVARGDKYVPDPVLPILPPISFDTWQSIDMRVCEVLKASEIRKARNNLKLTVFDGLDKITIVSGIKNEADADALVGKKVVVVRNLEPTRITGVTSEGMMLCTVNNASGTQVLTVGDDVPPGTRIV